MVKKYVILVALGILTHLSFLQSEEEGRDLANPKGPRASSLEFQDEWFPTSELFKPFLADPRKVTYSVGYRACDEVLGKHFVAVSLGEELSFYRWKDVKLFNRTGDLQIGLVAGTWVVFDFDSQEDFADMVNADYMVGILLTYAHDRWSYRLRTYHLSSHLGDEYLVSNPGTERLNPSFETVDLFASYDLTEELRFYGGAGFIMRSDRTFPLKNAYGELGAELRVLREDYPGHQVYMQPFLAMHFRFLEDHGWDSDSTYALGIEWGRLNGEGKKFRSYMEYHDGYSLEGQFSKIPSSYFTFNIGMGY